jgi:hypothetical protein
MSFGKGYPATLFGVAETFEYVGLHVSPSYCADYVF